MGYSFELDVIPRSILLIAFCITSFALSTLSVSRSAKIESNKIHNSWFCIYSLTFCLLLSLEILYHSVKPYSIIKVHMSDSNLPSARFRLIDGRSGTKISCRNQVPASSNSRKRLLPGMEEYARRQFLMCDGCSRAWIILK